MGTKTVEKMALIRMATDHVLEGMIKREELEHVPLKGRPRCDRVYLWEDDSGDAGYVIEMCGVSPDAEQFAKRVSDLVSKATDLYVEVEYGW